ncbi:hypothetical protein [Streptomyces sp. Ac-502]|uniref:hypothetical protein n=1 Tax=Streptomyces sp. Ac-502 TaxID=3342801 RepID=UPI0038622AA3
MQRFTEDDFGITRLMSAFHLDWSNYAKSEYEVLEAALGEGADTRDVMSLRHDAALLFDRLPSGVVEELWGAGIEASGFFGRRVPSGTQWTGSIIERCDAWLSQRESISRGRADQCDGHDSASAILLEIQGTDHLGTELTSALTQCVRLCTPDLAFRILLRVLLCKGEAISHEQYEKFQSIGADLGYGEFLISAPEHLVAR